MSPLTYSSTDTVYFTPSDAPAVLSTLLGLIDGAKATLRLQMYGMTDLPIIDALAAAHTRGIDVKAIFDHSQASGPTEVAMLHRLLLTVPAANILIGTSPVNHALLHVKALTIDAATVAHGSFNYSPSALQQVNDLHVAPSPELAAHYTDLFDQTWAWVLAHEPAYQTMRTTPAA